MAKKDETDPVEKARVDALRVRRGDLQLRIGRRLQAARKAAGLSLESIAHATGIARGTVGHWETGKNGINAAEMAEYLSLVGGSAHAIIAETSAEAVDLAARIDSLDAENRRAVIEFLEDREARQRRSPSPHAGTATPAKKGAALTTARKNTRARAR